jgi:acyl carrier protein
MIESQICAELCAHLRTSVLAEGVDCGPDTRLGDIGVDSTALVDLLLFVERRFGVVVPEEQLTRANLESPAALARCVGALASAGGRGGN